MNPNLSPEGYLDWAESGFKDQTDADMKLNDLQRLERDEQNRRAALARNIKLGRANPNCDQAKEDEMVIAMTEEERKAWFEKLKKEAGL